MAGKIDEQCQKLETSMQSKFDTFNSKFDSIDEKIVTFNTKFKEILKTFKGSHANIDLVQMSFTIARVKDLSPYSTENTFALGTQRK